MEIEIKEIKENVLLQRKEIYAVADHRGEPTPSRESVRSLLAAKLNADKELLILISIKSHFGMGQSIIEAHLYENREAMIEIEPLYRLQRNKLIELSQ